MSLETITGNLRDGYKQLQPGTMLHVDELMNERRTNHDLRDLGIYTADGEVYSLDGARKTPTLRITRELRNPVLLRIDDAFGQLTRKGNYSVLPHDFEQVLAAPETVRIALPRLRLQGDNKEWRYLEIRTEDGFIKTEDGYEPAKKEEKKVKERFGYTSENLAMLHDSPQKITETLIFFLNPDYVRKHAKEGAIARASWLGSFDGVSQFNAYDRGISNYDRVRGVRRGVVAEGVAQKKDSADQNPIMAEQQVLEVRGILSYSDKYVGTVNEEAYLRERQRAEEQLLALLKK